MFLLEICFIQVADNHVLKYTPPDEYESRIKAYSCIGHKKKLGCLLVGADSTDPQKVSHPSLEACSKPKLSMS